MGGPRRGEMSQWDSCLHSEKNDHGRVDKIGTGWAVWIPTTLFIKLLQQSASEFISESEVSSLGYDTT